jgi:hypothetical protein
MIAQYNVIEPIDVTDAMLVSSSVAEDSTGAWVSGQAYTAGSFVHRVGTHSVYVAKVAVTSTTPPETDPDRWENIRPTNRWAMFDYSKSTKTTAVSSMTVVMAYGRIIDTVAVYAATGSTVSIQMTDPVDGQVYANTLTMDASNPQSFFEWCFGGLAPIPKVIFSGLPPYAFATVTVTITGSEVSVGALVSGQMTTIGATTRGLEIEQKDYSTIETDVYGVTSLVARETSNVMDANIEVPSEFVNARFALMERLTGIPCLWIGLDGMNLLPSVILGWKVQFKAVVDYYHYSTVRLKVQEIA